MASRFEKAGTTATYGLDMLYKHCEDANKLNWVQASGRPYFVAVREDANGRKHHYIDRKA